MSTRNSLGSSFGLSLIYKSNTHKRTQKHTHTHTPSLSLSLSLCVLLSNIITEIFCQTWTTNSLGSSFRLSRKHTNTQRHTDTDTDTHAHTHSLSPSLKKLNDFEKLELRGGYPGHLRDESHCLHSADLWSWHRCTGIAPKETDDSQKQGEDETKEAKKRGFTATGRGWDERSKKKRERERSEEVGSSYELVVWKFVEWGWKR